MLLLSLCSWTALQAEQELVEYLLPSGLLGSIGDMHSLSEVWSMLATFAWTTRFRIYSDLRRIATSLYSLRSQVSANRMPAGLL